MLSRSYASGLLAGMILAPGFFISAFGATLPGTAHVFAPAGGFAIDGDLRANTPTQNIGDWVTNGAGAGGFVLYSDGTPVNAASTFHVMDPYNSPVDFVSSGGKYYENPVTSWLWKYGNAGDKVDINHAVVHITTATNGHQWAVVSADRLSGNGDAYIDFEFLQDVLTVTPTNASGIGGFTNTAPHGGRRLNDFLVTLAFTGGGSTAEFYVQQWKTNSATGGFDYFTIDIASSLPSNSVFAAVNSAGSTVVPYGAFGGTSYALNTFAEAAVDLTALIGSSFDPCTSLAVKTIVVKTKQSASRSASLGDMITPLSVDLTLGLADAGPSQTKCSEGAATAFALSGVAHPNINSISSMSWSVVSATSGAAITSAASCTNCTALPATVHVTNAPATAVLRLTVTDTAGCTKSDDVVLTVNPQTTVNGLANQATCPGETASFSATATGLGVTCQWFKGGDALPGQTNVNLILNNVSALDAGTYSVTVSGLCGQPVTQSATLTVNEMVAVSAAPLDLTKCPGEPASFSVTATGSGLSYQWFKNGNPLNGEAGSNLTLGSVSAADAGTYSVTVSGTCGEPVTQSATLTVNENVAVSSPPANQTKCPGQTANFSVIATGTGLSYKWSKGINTLVGQTSSSLALNNVTATDAGTYSVTVSGACGQSVTHSATLIVNENVAVTSPPANLTKCPGDSASFSVTATGSGLSYQWFKGGNALNGQTASSLNLNNVSASDAGTYSVIVSGACGEPVLRNASLTVNQNVAISTPPTSLTKCPGQTASFSVIATGTGLSYQWFKAGNALSGQTGTSLTLNNVSAADAGTYSVTVSGTCGQPVTQSATLTVNENVAVSSPPVNLTKCPGQTASFSVSATGTGLSYQWSKGANVLAGQTGSSLTLNNVSSADAGTYSVTISGACGQPETRTATLTVNENVAVSSPPANLTKCPGASASFSVTGTGTGLSYQWFKGASILTGQTGSTLTLNSVTAADAGTYNVTVSGACGQPLNHSATLTVNENVAVSTPPASLTKCPSETASFSVTATGTGLSYQWFKGVNALVGQTGSSLTLNNVSAADAGSYSVTVSGTCGQPVTHSATLTVNENVAVSSPPVSLTKCPGDTASFSVSATGVGLSYQWSKGGNALPGQTATLTLNNVSSADAGTYSVTVSGACGQPVTRSATLTVNENVAVSSPPVNLTKCPGQSASFSVTATGTGLSYQWLKDGNALVGQTSSSLTLNSVNATNAGTYSVTVSGTCGQSLTHNATLTVLEPVVIDPMIPQTACPGGVISFNAVTHGTGPFTYIWIKDGKVLPGETANVMPINSTTVLDAGSYTVVASGACTSATNHVTLTLHNPTTATPLIGQTNCFGRNATFSTTAGGTGPFAYVWKKDGNVLAGTASSITIQNLKASDVGVYTVEVTGQCNSVSRSAYLAVESDGLISPAPFANPAGILITDFSPANPYPSSIDVFCVPKPLTRVSVTISNLSHTYGTDLDILLLSPSGQAIMLMSDAGSSYAINNATLVFSDAAANSIPELTPILSGIFKPTNYGASDNIPLPAPLGPYASSLSDLNGTDANGTWSLFVIDDAKVDTGIIAGGWSMVLGWEVLPPTLSAPAMQQDGSFRALLHGQSGKTYVIEGSSDFINWAPVSTNLLIQTTAEIVDLESASFGQRFYRAVYQP